MSSVPSCQVANMLLEKCNLSEAIATNASTREALLSNSLFLKNARGPPTSSLKSQFLTCALYVSAFHEAAESYCKSHLLVLDDMLEVCDNNDKLDAYVAQLDVKQLSTERTLLNLFRRLLEKEIACFKQMLPEAPKSVSWRSLIGGGLGVASLAVLGSPFVLLAAPVYFTMVRSHLRAEKSDLADEGHKKSGEAVAARGKADAAAAADAGQSALRKMLLQTRASFEELQDALDQSKIESLFGSADSSSKDGHFSDNDKAEFEALLNRELKTVTSMCIEEFRKQNETQMDVTATASAGSDKLRLDGTNPSSPAAAGGGE